MERPRRKVRFARLIHWRGRVLGGPSVRAASGGNHTPTASLPSVVDQKQEQSEPAGGPVADGAAAVTIGVGIGWLGALPRLDPANSHERQLGTKSPATGEDG
jgi:hypothetical protein